MINQKILISIVGLLALSGVGFAVYKSQNSVPVPTPSDQTVQGGVNATTGGTPGSPGRVASGYVAGHVSIGPNCPGPEREGVPCPVPPEAYSSREVFVYDNDGVTLNVKGKIDSEGNFKISLGPGKYFVQIVPAGIGPGEKKPVTIKSWETATLDFDIDTGMR